MCVPPAQNCSITITVIFAPWLKQPDSGTIEDCVCRALYDMYGGKDFGVLSGEDGTIDAAWKMSMKPFLPEVTRDRAAGFV